MRYIRMWIVFFQNCLSREMEYRGHFFMQFLIDIIWYSVHIATFEILYGQTASIAGYTKQEILVFLGAMFMIDAINMIFFSRNFWEFPQLVAKGDLDFFLIRPVSTFFYSFTRYINVAAIVNFAIASGILTYGVLHCGSEISVWNVLAFCLLAASGSLVILAFQTIICAIAIFTIAGDGLQMVWHSIDQLGHRPHEIYSKRLQQLFITLLPMAMLASYPTKALLGKLEIGNFLWGSIVGIIFVVFAYMLFQRSLRYYSGASS